MCILCILWITLPGREKIPVIRLFSLCKINKIIHNHKRKYPQAGTGNTRSLAVDNVEKSRSEQFFADFLHVTRPHSYQQITVYAIFQ